MKRAFKYDVAISVADFDALAAAELKRRLEQRLSKPVFTIPRAKDGPVTAAVTAALRKSIEKEARVVVVLFQRLWGTTPANEAEVAAVKARIGKVKRKDVVVVPLDTSIVPSWLKGQVIRSSGGPTSAVVIDAIVDAAGRRITSAREDLAVVHAQHAGIDAQQYLASLGWRRVITFQPDGRFWTFQLIEAGIFVALAAAAVVAAVSLVRRRAA